MSWQTLQQQSQLKSEFLGFSESSSIQFAGACYLFLIFTFLFFFYSGVPLMLEWEHSFWRACEMLENDASSDVYIFFYNSADDKWKALCFTVYCVRRLHKKGITDQVQQVQWYIMCCMKNWAGQKLFISFKMHYTADAACLSLTYSRRQNIKWRVTAYQIRKTK